MTVIAWAQLPALEKVKLYKARYLVEMTVARHLFEVGATNMDDVKVQFARIPLKRRLIPLISSRWSL